MAKILVVDDEPDLQALIKQKFRKKIRENTYEFLFAENGKQALDVLSKNENVDLVLSDINMPVMDGLTLLSELNETHQLLKSVIVSAYGDMENIRTAMNRGAFDFVTKPINFTDLELTMEKTLKHVAHLHKTLKAVQENNILKMYVDETVLNFMDSKVFENSIMKSETTEATVLFIDICGFTTISEAEPPDLVVQLLNSYFDVMVKEIIDQDGFVDKFIGDALMAVFRGEYHLDRAIDAAIALRTKILELPPIVDSLTYKPNVSIGINSGELVSGNIGSASLRRLDFTVIGDVVNTASRFESAAAPGQIIISEKSYEKVKESFKCKKVGVVSMKNKANPETIYEVIE